LKDALERSFLQIELQPLYSQLGCQQIFGISAVDKDQIASGMIHQEVYKNRTKK
jgi:hypothetical protein